MKLGPAQAKVVYFVLSKLAQFPREITVLQRENSRACKKFGKNTSIFFLDISEKEKVKPLFANVGEKLMNFYNGAKPRESLRKQPNLLFHRMSEKNSFLRLYFYAVDSIQQLQIVKARYFLSSSFWKMKYNFYILHCTQNSHVYVYTSMTAAKTAKTTCFPLQSTGCFRTAAFKYSAALRRLNQDPICRFPFPELTTLLLQLQFRNPYVPYPVQYIDRIYSVTELCSYLKPR